MAVWIWETDVTAVSIQLRTAGGPYEIRRSYLDIFRFALLFLIFCDKVNKRLERDLPFWFNSIAYAYLKFKRKM